jgi:hypothetical protein
MELNLTVRVVNGQNETMAKQNHLTVIVYNHWTEEHMKLEHTMMMMGRKNVKLSHLLQNSTIDVWMARCGMGW